MAEERIMNFPYIPRDVFNAHIQNIADKNEIGRKIDALDAKFDQRQKNSEARLNKRIDNLEAKLDRTKTDLEGQIKKLDTKIDGVKNELNAKIDGVEAKLTAKIDGVEAKLTAKIDGVEKTMYAGFANIDKRFDDINNRLDGISQSKNTGLIIIGLVLTAAVFIAPIIAKFL